MNDYQPNQRNRTIAKILQLQRYLRRGTMRMGKPFAAGQFDAYRLCTPHTF